MLNLKHKLEAAKKEYETARTKLENVRAAYNNGPQKEYAETQTNLSELRATIKENETALEEGKANLANELKRSNGKTTEVVKKILSDRRSIDDVIDQCKIILQEVENRASDLLVSVSKAAREYQYAYAQATECWWKVNTYSALQECGEKLCAAMAVMPPPGVDQDHSSLSHDAYPSKTLILKELDKMFAEYSGDRHPYRAELGDCNLGALRSSDILSLAKVHAKRKGTETPA